MEKEKTTKKHIMLIFLKRTISVFLVFVLGFSLFILKPRAYNYDCSIGKSISWQTKEGLWPFQKTAHWKIIYWQHSNSERLLFEGLTHTTYWNPYYAATGSIGFSNSVTVSQTSSITQTSKIGYEIPLYVEKVINEIGGSYSYSTKFTNTKEENHTRTFDKSSPIGYYSLQAAMNADRYYVEVNKNYGRLPGYNVETISRGHIYKFHSNKPYVYLHFTSYQH